MSEAAVTADRGRHVLVACNCGRPGCNGQQVCKDGWVMEPYLRRMSLREQILQAQDIKSEDVHVPEWDVTLRVQAMTGRQRAQLLQTAIRPDGKVDLVKLYPESIISCVVDPETGKPVFEPADRDALNLKSGAALERVAQAIMRLSGLSSDAIGDLEKNLSAASE